MREKAEFNRNSYSGNNAERNCLGGKAGRGKPETETSNPDDQVNSTSDNGSTYKDDGNTEFIGEHKLVWKWLPETNATLYISKMTNGNLDATGGSSAYGSSFSLEGEIRKISESTLEFDGKIKTFQYGRNGYHCEYNGKKVFKKAGEGNYWRLAFNDCKGSTDYIDIFE